VQLHRGRAGADKLILQAVHQAAKEEKPTANEIALHYQTLSGKPIKSSLLLQELNKAEEAGLLTREISSRDDEPVLIWKSQVSLRDMSSGSI